MLPNAMRPRMSIVSVHPITSLTELVFLQKIILARFYLSYFPLAYFLAFVVPTGTRYQQAQQFRVRRRERLPIMTTATGEEL